MGQRLIIGLSGKQRSGKNYFANVIQEYLKTYFNVPTTIVGLADALKNDVCKQLDISLEDLEELKNKDDRYRKVLIAHGSQMRALNVDYWVEKVLEIEGNLIVPDIRFMNELVKFKSAPNTVTGIVRIYSPRELRSTRGNLSNEEDASETSLDDYTDWDMQIINDECHFPAYNLPAPLSIKLALFLQNKLNLL